MSKWEVPKNPGDNPFGVANLGEFLPSMDEIPSEFKRHSGTKWNTVVSLWFFNGLDPDTLTAKDGIDKMVALKHVGVCLGSFEPKHEHKEAGCAYLMSLWFE